MRFKKSMVGLVAIAAIGLGLAACGPTSTSANKKDSAVAGAQLSKYQTVQPIPQFDFSQLRQNLIEIETAQTSTTPTTTFFFNQGIAKPVQSCPSVGFPIPSEDQLSNPQSESTVSNSRNPYTLPQIEQTGVYTGGSTGTYVMCIDAKGSEYADYWEGFVQTVTGPAVWNPTTQQVELTGPPSFTFTQGKK